MLYLRNAPLPSFMKVVFASTLKSIASELHNVETWAF